MLFVIWNVHNNLNIKDIYSAKKEHTPSKLYNELVLQVIKQILSIFDFCLFLQGRIGDLQHLF